MKKSILIVVIILGFSATANAQFDGLLNKAKEKATAKVDNAASKITLGENPIAGLGKSAASTNTKAMVGKWKVEGIICNTNIEELKNQLVAQEQGYNDEYKGFDWIFKNDGTIDITSKAGRGEGQYELAGDKITMVINKMPSQFTLKFEDGQMFLIQESALNTIYYVFVKR